ncbi:MAG: hypothetical protein ABIA74_04375 [bacterium]
MKNKLKIILFISFISLNSFYLFGNEQAKNFVENATSNFDVDMFLNALSNVVNEVKQLDFDRSVEFAVRIPVANQELVYNWGFVGSGDLFTPINSVKPYLRSVAVSASKDNFALDLGKALLEDKVNQYGQKVAVVDRILQFELSPKVVFSIKLILLLKKINKVAQEKIYADALRLLIRLVQVDDFKVLKENETISSYLPASVVSNIQKIAPELLIFMDEVFNAFAQTNEEEGLTEKFVSTMGFVFNDKKLAERFFDKWQNYKGNNFVAELNKAVVAAGYEKCDDYDQFIGLKETGLLNEKLFAVKDFGAVNTSIQMPDSLKTQALSVNQFPKVLKIDSENETWILYVTDKLGAAQTVRALISSLIQTFKDYKDARSNYFKQNSVQDAQFKKLLDEQQRKIAKMEKFLAISTGQASVARVENELNRINLEFAATGNVSSINSELEQLTEKEKELKVEIKESSSNGKLNQEQVKQILQKQDELNKVKKRKRALNQKIENSKKTTKQRKNELDEALNDLHELEVIVVQQKAVGESVNSDLQLAIEDLKEKIEQLQGNDDSGLDFNSRLRKRLLIAQAYLNESELLENELNLKLSEIDMVIDSSKKRIEELKFSVFKEQYELRIDDLRSEAKKIMDDNDKAREFYELKEAVKFVGDISDEQSQKIQKLENAVGYIVEGKQCVSKLMGYLQNNKEIKEFVDLVNSQIPEYQGIRDVLIKRLEFLAANSEYIKNNKATLDVLIKKLLPEFPISLRDCCSSN